MNETRRPSTIALHARWEPSELSRGSRDTVSVEVMTGVSSLPLSRSRMRASTRRLPRGPEKLE